MANYRCARYIQHKSFHISATPYLANYDRIRWYPNLILLDNESLIIICLSLDFLVRYRGKVEITLNIIFLNHW